VSPVRLDLDGQVISVRHERVTFPSEGLRLAGDLRIPSGSPAAVPGLVFTGPYTGVKDQVVGSYASKLADCGFVTLAFDHRNFGESDGLPRQHEDAQGKLSDLREAVSFLLARPDISSVGVVGVCLGGSYALRAAALDPRIAAMAGVAGGYNSPGWFRSQMGTSAYAKTLEELLTGYAAAPDRMIPAVGLSGEVAMGGREPHDYYATERGSSTSWRNEMTAFSAYSLLTLDAVGVAELVAPRPVLLVHGRVDEYCPPSLAQATFDACGEPKRLVWLETTCHIDLYDQPEHVDRAVAELADHFGRHLAGHGLTGS
jgi:fermentation-respiration switch protein FrsA (DUF1100 family)